MKIKTKIQRARNFILGFVMCAIVFSFVMSVSGAARTRTATLTYNDVKVVIDGKPVTLTDILGGEIEPVFIDDILYVPMSPMARAFGKTSVYEAGSKTIFIGESKQVNSVPDVWLDEIAYFNFQKSINGRATWRKWETASDRDSTGETHTRGILYTTNRWQYTEYLLNEKYRYFKGKISLHYDNRSTTSTTILKIFGDGKELHNMTIKAGVLPQEFDVDVTGVTILKIQLDVQNNPHDSIWSVGIVNAGFYE